MGAVKTTTKAGVTGTIAAGPPALFWENQDQIASFDYLSITIASAFSITWIALTIVSYFLLSYHRRLKYLETLTAPPR
jgi:hypothetical protein